ncbi:MAG: PolC-type DNA polymerase III [Clostridia bacterium]|nr:PolC-type DNA polymerase III [Clostridia bacterium]
MAPLLYELVGEELAEELKDAEVTLCRLHKQEKKLELGILSQNVIEKRITDRICEEIKSRFGVFSVDINVKIKNFEINAETIGIAYENVKKYVTDALPAAMALLMKSEAALSDGSVKVSLKFGGKSTLLEVGAERIMKQAFLEIYSFSCDVELLEEKHEQAVEMISEIEEDIKRASEVASKEKVVRKRVSGPKEEKKEDGKVDDGIIIGKSFTGEVTPINDIFTDETHQNSRSIIVSGEVISFDSREIRNEKTILEIFITDKTNSIACKAFLKNEEFAEIKGQLKGLKAVSIRGRAQYDTFSREVVIMIADMMRASFSKRTDDSEEKRVELHCHTSMSALDAISNPSALISRAASWGHKAIAITDHGVVQAYPEAYDAGKKNNIKIIYGVEGYLMGDEAKLVYNEIDMPLSGSFVVFDIETTGLSAKFGEIIEIAGVKIEGGKTVDTFSKFVKPQKGVPYRITELTNITNNMLEDADPIDVVLKEFFEFASGCVLVAHNANFDVGFIRKKAEELSMPCDFCYIDTLALSRKLLPAVKRHKLDRVAKYLGFSFEGHHRAINDAEVTARIFLHFVDLLNQTAINNVKYINEKLLDESVTKHTDLYHIIILVKNMVGLKNLYRLVSMAHLDNFYRKPRLTKKMITEYREGLILGSACEAGELYSAILSGKTQDEIRKIAEFYDYLEIQPLGNNEFMIRNETVSGNEDLELINREIVELGDSMGKMTVGTCDVHFTDPADSIYRCVLMTGQDYDDAANQAPLYFRTTEEMLNEFKYLGGSKAKEIVITNPNKIADMTEEIIPIPEETYAPEMPGSVEEIQKLSYDKAHEIYGEELPKIVEDRMQKELRPIIKYGFSVMYMIAQKLVSKSLSDGYLVGSRGSVGSSFIAYLSGITEVNSLAPHYVCPKCKTNQFFTHGEYSCGADLPDAFCPNCGEKYVKYGYDIPFETFLGFDGDKEPDIDLNFSGAYQPVAHKYTEELFGEGHVFRAGTIGTFAESTARGYVLKYAEKNNITLNRAEMKRLSSGLEGVKRTTGQHPGGVMIVPRANEVYEFTPIQHPADDTGTDIITTHFDYHSISGRLLKLDILGHDDPTMIRMLEDLTGLDAKTIPIDDKPTMSLFTSTEALGVTPEEINSQTGTFAVPEFGTKFVRQMLLDTKPTTFSELIRISGLSHGTDVWLGNAQDLVRNGTATLPEVICTRDDIMIYLLHHGVEDLTSFKIMEKVRKGKGLTPEDEAIMREHDVPEWYIDSCKKIKYMFPKAHAAAYVTMAFRIAYFKVHYPLQFYIAYYTVRADEFDASLMLNGKEKVVASIKEIESNPDATDKDKRMVTILEVCNEMYARGIEFLPIDLYKSHDTDFLEEDGKIRPPFNTIPNFGQIAAHAIVEARKTGGEFISIQDLTQRAKIGKSVVEKLKEFGVLDGMDETSQIKLFDF